MNFNLDFKLGSFLLKIIDYDLNGWTVLIIRSVFGM